MINLKNLFTRSKQNIPRQIDESYRLYSSFSENNPSVIFCENLIANSIASLPLNIYFRSNTGRQIIQWDHPIFTLINRQPNLNETPTIFYSNLVKHILRHGNAFVFKLKDSAGKVSQLILIDPTTVRVDKIGSLKVFYVDSVQYTFDDIIHIPSPWGYNGLIGKSVLDFARDTIRTANKLQSYTDSYYDNNVNSRLKLHIDDPNTPPEKIQQAVDFAANAGSKFNSGKPVVEIGLNKLDSLTLPNQSNDLIDNKEFAAKEIHLYHGVPYELASSKDQTAASLDLLNKQCMRTALIPITDRIEECMAQGLLTAYELGRYSLAHDYSEFLRPDAKTLNEMQNENLKLGKITPNEARAYLDLAPFPDDIAGDTPIRDGVGPISHDVIDAYGATARIKLAEASEKLVSDGAEQNKDNKGK